MDIKKNINYLIIAIFLISCLLRKILCCKIIENKEPTQKEMGDYIDNFFKQDAVQYTCLDYEPIDKSICKTNQKRRCIQENHSFCNINADDTAFATEYAYRKLCKDKGHCPVQNEDGSYRCEFTKESCLASSRKRKPLHDEVLDNYLIDENGHPMTDPKELETAKRQQEYNTHYWIDGVGCIDGTYSGISAFENYCTVDHPCSMGLWKFDKNNFTCSITDEYCSEMKMKKNSKGMCIPKNVIAERLAGKFITRGYPCPRYANLWGGGITNGSSTVSDILTEQCNNHINEPLYYNKDGTPVYPLPNN